MKRFILAIVFVFCCSLGMTPPAEAGLISKEQEIEMGRQTAMQLEAKYGVVQDYALQERVNRIGQSLVKVSERQDLEYSFKVLNSDEVNALACPGGFIYVFKGLIDYMPSDAELAGVLGHEITHVVKKHTVHQIEKQLLTTLAFAIVTKGDLGIAGLATQALAAGYSRTDERGADKGGFNLCVAAGYNPYSVVLTINKLEDLAKEQGNPGYGIFSSHPEPEERLKRVMKQIKALKVHPEITLNEDNTARVHEGDWGFNITQTVGNDRPEYRAYMLAGGLYCVRERDKGHIDPYRFIVYDNGGSATISL
ncbi:MAG: M48 family metallopeptidase [Phascolarctobacterium faecium]